MDNFACVKVCFFLVKNKLTFLTYNPITRHILMKICNPNTELHQPRQSTMIYSVTAKSRDAPRRDGEVSHRASFISDVEQCRG